MPELKAVVLWRFEARKPSDAVTEIVTARDRFTERMAARPTVAYVGAGATFLLDRAADLHLMPVAVGDECPMVLARDGNLPVWDILICGDEAKETPGA